MVNQHATLVSMANDLESLRDQYLAAEAEGRTFTPELTARLFGETCAGVPLHGLLRELEGRTEQEEGRTEQEGQRHQMQARRGVAVADPFATAVEQLAAATALAKSEGLTVPPTQPPDA